MKDENFQDYQTLRRNNWNKLFNQGNVYDAIRWLNSRKKDSSEDHDEDKYLIDQCLRVIQIEFLRVKIDLVKICESIDNKNSLYEVEGKYKIE